MQSDYILKSTIENGQVKQHREKDQMVLLS